MRQEISHFKVKMTSTMGKRWCVQDCSDLIMACFSTAIIGHSASCLTCGEKISRKLMTLQSVADIKKLKKLLCPLHHIIIGPI